MKDINPDMIIKCQSEEEVKQLYEFFIRSGNTGEFPIESLDDAIEYFKDGKNFMLDLHSKNWFVTDNEYTVLFSELEL